MEDVEAPALTSGQVRVRVHSVGLCKSDIYGYSGVNDRRDAVLGDGGVLVMGHEAAGYVDELGPGTDGPPLGSPVAVNPIFGCGTCSDRTCSATCPIASVARYAFGSSGSGIPSGAIGAAPAQ